MFISICSKGRAVIAGEIREKYDVEQGTKLKVPESGDMIILIPS